MAARRSWKLLLVVLLITSIAFVCFYKFHTSETEQTTAINGYMIGEVQSYNFKEKELERSFHFDMDAGDVMVFLHIQKTGGTAFGSHLTENLVLKRPCKCKKGVKKCRCQNSDRDDWLFSRYSSGWACGLHADWTELKNCVHDVLTQSRHGPLPRRYLYVTVLRDPMRRYLSEWRHVQRGATWKTATLKCDGRYASFDEVPLCFEGEDWGGVSLKEFASCKHNLASNRQTRMLANLSLVGCYNSSVMPAARRDAIMLKSAKQNLRDMAFFGLTHYQREMQYLFEHTFHLQFIDPFQDRGEEQRANHVELPEEEMQMVINNNKLDIELYQYAKALFLKRYNYTRTREKERDRNVRSTIESVPGTDSMSTADTEGTHINSSNSINLTSYSNVTEKNQQVYSSSQNRGSDKSDYETSKRTLEQQGYLQSREKRKLKFNAGHG